MITGMNSLNLPAWYVPAHSVMPHRSVVAQHVPWSEALTVHISVFFLSTHSCNLYCRLTTFKQTPIVWLIKNKAKGKKKAREKWDLRADAKKMSFKGRTQPESAGWIVVFCMLLAFCFQAKYLWEWGLLKALGAVFVLLASCSKADH